MQPQHAENDLLYLKEMQFLIEQTGIQGITDIVPSYDALTILFDRSQLSHDMLMRNIELAPAPESELNWQPKHIEIPVCYEFGLDWERIMDRSGLDLKTALQLHSETEYRVAMIGFLPGFIFLDGLNEQLNCPRLDAPRTSIPKGAVGIGGSQTGLYSMESPGGWNIIGRTPVSLFDIEKDPPIEVQPGDILTFKRISKAEFGDLNGNS
tara:strand:- start:14477 stop:15103 length:627 start_codon:yes stop_codon:yes gene_type:complete